jgi:antitoxin HigA-1
VSIKLPHSISRLALVPALWWQFFQTANAATDTLQCASKEVAINLLVDFFLTCAKQSATRKLKYNARGAKMADMIEPVTPGELLKEEFLEPLGISQYRLAKETGIPAQRIGQIVLGSRAITADTDLRLCKFFGLSDGYWLRVQAAYDTEITRGKIAPELERIKRF